MKSFSLALPNEKGGSLDQQEEKVNKMSLLKMTDLYQS